MFSEKCDRAKKRKAKAWKRMEKKTIQRTEEERKLTSREYVKYEKRKIRYEKDIVDRCKDFA